MPVTDAMMKMRSEYLKAAARPDARFAPVKRFEDIPGAPYFESRKWSTAVFGGERGPQAPDAQAKHSYHLSENEADLDLLRHEFSAQGTQVVVTESRAFLVISLRGPGIPGEQPLEKAVALTSSLLAVPHPVQYRWLENTGKSQEFSTRPELSYDELKEWSDRIDGIVTKDSIDLVIYKVAPNSDPRFLNTSDWFPAKFRRAPR